MRPPRLRCTLFPFIYPPHLLLLPAAFGLYLLLQTYPYFRALYVIPVRRTKGLPTASFRFHLTMDTLAVQLYTSSLPRRVRDFHPLERAHGAQTKREALRLLFHFPINLSICFLSQRVRPQIFAIVPPGIECLYILCLLLQFFCGFLLSLLHYHHLWDSMYHDSPKHVSNIQSQKARPRGSHCDSMSASKLPAR